MKKLIFLIAFVCALAASSFAQSASDITVSGVLYNGFNDPCTSCTFTVTVTRRDGVAVQSTPRTVTSHVSTGAVSFTLPRKSFVTFQGQFTVGRYNWRSGISMFLPDQSTIDLVDIQSVEDAAAALVAVSAAPSDAQYIVATTNGTLSAEQSLGALTTGLLKNTVSGSTGTLSAAVAGTDYVAPGTTTSSGLTMATARILGRSTASTGAIEEISIGSGLSLSGGTLSASGGGAVSSVFGRTGAVVAATNDYTWAQIDKTTSSLADITTRSASDLSSGTLAAARGGAGTVNGILKADGAGLVSAASAGTDYEVPLTFSTGLTRSTNTITVNTSQNIATLSNLTSNGLVTTSGGAGTLSVTVPGTGVLTALAVNTGSAGAFVVNGGDAGTPSALVLTNATGLPLSTGVTGDLPFANFVQAGSAGFVGATGAGDYSHRTPAQVTAALDAFVGDSGSGGTKGLVPAPASGDAAANKYLKADGTWATVAGGGTPGGSNTQVQYNNAGSFGGVAGFTFNGTSTISLGVAGTSVGAIGFRNATSGTITLQPVTGALGTVTLSLPAATDTLVGRATTDTLSNKTLASPSLTGNLSGATTSEVRFGANIVAYEDGVGPKFTDFNTGAMLTFDVQNLTGSRIVTWPNVGGNVALTTGTLTNGNCAEFDASGRIVDSGGTCGGGSGTVTSVGLALPGIFSISGSPVTSSGTLTAALVNQNANLVFAGPGSGGPAVPTFRALVANDYVTMVGDSGAGGVKGAVPAPAAGDAAANKFLKADGVWTAIPSAPVTSVFGRTGAVVAQNGDYSFSQISGTVADGQLSANVTLQGNTVTGTGAIVLATSPTIVTPTIASFVNAAHNHENVAGGGQLNATNIFNAGTVPVARLPLLVGDSGAGGIAGLVPAPAAGDAAANKFLKANGTWSATGSGLGDPGSNGIVVRTALNTTIARSIAAGASGGLSATNADGVSGNPTIDYATINSSGLGYNLPGQGGTVFAGDTSAALVSSADEIRVLLFYCDRRITADRISLNGVVDAGGKNAGFAIYSADGNTKIVDSGAISTAAWSGANNFALSGTVTFGPGYFYLAWTADSTTPTIRSASAVANYYAPLNNGSGTVIGTAANVSTGGVLPATLGALTDSANLPVPIVRFYKN